MFQGLMGVWLWLTNLLQVYKGLFHCSAAGQTAITSHAMFIWCKPCAFGPIIIDWNVVVLHIHLLNQFWLPFEEQFSAGYRHEKSMRSKIKSIIFLGPINHMYTQSIITWNNYRLTSCSVHNDSTYQEPIQMTSHTLHIPTWLNNSPTLS